MKLPLNRLPNWSSGYQDLMLHKNKIFSLNNIMSRGFSFFKSFEIHVLVVINALHSQEWIYYYMDVAPDFHAL